MNSVYLSVVIPVYNEEERIIPALKEIIAYLSSRVNSPNGSPRMGPSDLWGWEIIVVDDGSKDQTVKCVEEFASRHKGIILLTNSCNHGKGYVVRQGILSSKGEYVLFTDADLSAPISEVEKLLFHLSKGYDIAIGSRALKGSNIKTSFGRRIIGLTFNFIVRVLLLPDIVDTQCGFKCFRGEMARELFKKQKMDGFSFDVENLCLARMKGYRIKQIPVNWYQSFSTRVNLLRDPVKMFIDVLKIWVRLKIRRQM